MRQLKMKTMLLALLATPLFMVSCSDDDDSTPKNGTLEISLDGLDNLGANYDYEGWLIVDGNPVSTGTFDVDGTYNESLTFNRSQLKNASAFVLTIEPSPDTDPAPSAVHILAGDFSNNSANLTVGHSAALGSSFTQATGQFILATPTNGMNTNELSGVWFLEPPHEETPPAEGLHLPTLPAGWEYEGWAVIDGKPVTTGKFTSTMDFDDFDGFSSTMNPGPPFPGEDFLMNAPSGLTFPTNLSGSTMVISVEPNPDNSTAPFTLKPLVGMAPEDAQDHVVYPMNNNATASNPTGTASYR